MDESCRIELLGEMRVVQNGQITTRFRTQKSAMLLAYLALNLKQSHSRDRLIDLFWPDMDITAGRDNLSTALSALRRQFEPPGTPAGSLLIADRQNIRLNSAIVTTDVQCFEESLKAAERAETEYDRANHYEIAVTLYRGELLPSAYDEWAILEQSRLRTQFLEALHHWSISLEQSKRYEEALPVVIRLITLDPYHEEAVRTQMRLLARLGRPASVQEVYLKLEGLLREELDVAPARATRDLAERLRRDPNALSGEQQAPLLLPTGVPPAAAAVTPPNKTPVHLPIQLTRFFGREKELQELERLLLAEETRLVTLLGPGGAGKTRLSIETASRVAKAFDGRVWFVGLADIPDASLILYVLSNVLHLPPDPGSDPMERIITYLGELPCLLVLDNMEHLLRSGDMPKKSENLAASGCAALIRLLIERVPQLKCLATSRQALRIGGEREFPLPPLSIPLAADSPELLLNSESVALYTDRAKHAKPDFALTENNSEAVAGLCRMLEGMPLAIEMAAAWAKALPPARMLERLETRLDMLISRRRDLPPRHQSMRAAIEWSYDLLEPGLQKFFQRFSVFRGGSTLEMAEIVCGQEALNSLAELQEQSLLVAIETTDDTRYRMLEPLREFAAEKLSECNESEHYHRLHAESFVRLAEEIGNIVGSDLSSNMDRLEADVDNIRAVMAWCSEGGDRSQIGLRAAAALWRFWQLRDHARESRPFVVHMLNIPEAKDHLRDRAGALHAAHCLSAMHGDYAASALFLEEAMQIARSLNDDGILALVLNEMGIITQDQGENEAAKVHYEESLKLNRRLNRRGEQSVNLCNLGVVAECMNDLEGAKRLYEEALSMQRELGDMRSIAIALNNLGDLAIIAGDYAQARIHQCESLKIGMAMGNNRNTTYVFESLAKLARCEEDFERAARMMGAAENLRERLHTPLAPIEQEEYNRIVDTVKKSLDPLIFETAYRTGKSYTLESAADYALNVEPA